VTGELLEATADAEAMQRLEAERLEDQEIERSQQERRSWRAHWTDLRMTLEGHDEAKVAGEGLVLSNWEI
jgi:hypothetical protein